MPVQRAWRRPLSARSSAFAPAAITNFFAIQYDTSGKKGVGATGGGYILSKGVVSRAALLSTRSPLKIETVVDGDPTYNARTTRRAVNLLLDRIGIASGHLRVEQEMGVPVGCGFGASSASAISATYAVAHVFGSQESKARQACSAHEAEILEQTGLGTVSVAYDSTGAGAITVPGEPGTAKFVNVKVPKGTMIVAASLGPYDKKDALSSPTISERINRLGNDALEQFLADPTFESLAEAGEGFSSSLGLMTPEVTKLAGVAKAAGASHASQNMIGYAVHSIVNEDLARKVATSLKSAGAPRVDTFDIGQVKAGVQ